MIAQKSSLDEGGEGSSKTFYCKDYFKIFFFLNPSQLEAPTDTDSDLQ